MDPLNRPVAGRMVAAGNLAEAVLAGSPAEADPAGSLAEVLAVDLADPAEVLPDKDQDLAGRWLC